MAEYIERRAALDIATEWSPDDDGSVGKTGDLRGMLDELEAIPAADVVEVRHGKWEQVEVRDYPNSNLMVASMWCPVCKRYHNEVYHYGNPTEMAHYCGFCGAKMDGGVNDA